MPKKRFSAEQIVALLRQIEITTAQGTSIALACRKAGISDQSYFHWRKEYGGLYHRGGEVRQGGPSRAVPASTFVKAPCFHKGLRSDEIPAILQKGEEELSRDDASYHTPDIHYGPFPVEKDGLADQTCRPRR